MQKIRPCLWFVDNADEAVKYYTSAFPNSKILTTTNYSEASAKVAGREVGSLMTVTFELDGQEFIALNGGPIFPFSPAISLVVHCQTEQEIDALFKKLSDGGQILMPLQKYPFSEKFGWTNDKFGLSWQLIMGSSKQKISPCFMFVQEQNGKAEEAINFYRSKFKNSDLVMLQRYTEDEPGTPGTVKRAVFTLAGQYFAAMDSSGPHQFGFTPAISLMIYCEDQKEVDKYWAELCEGGEPSQCGWLTDKFGISWQVVPTELDSILSTAPKEKSEKVIDALLQMTKIDIATLQEAYRK